MNTPPAKLRQRTVLMVFRSFYPEYGGPGIALWRLAPSLIEQGYRLRILCRFLPGLPRESRFDGAQIRRCGGGGRFEELRFIASVLIQLVLKRRHYEQVHVVHCGWLTFLIPLVARLLRRPSSFTMTLLDSDDPRGISRMNGPALKLRLFRLYDRYIHINPEQAARYQEIYGADDRLVEGSLGIDFEVFASPSPSERRAARSALGLEPEAPVAAFSGAVIRRKGIDAAVEIWMHVARARPNAVLLIVGPLSPSKEGKEEFIHEELRREIEKHGLEKHFRFLGETRDATGVRDVLYAADLFLFPSRNEGTPSAVLEAMGCEVVPVIAQLEGFAGVVVRDGTEGIVIPDDANAEAVARRITALIDNPALRAQLARAAKERAHELHSAEVAIESLRQAWRDTLPRPE